MRAVRLTRANGVNERWIGDKNEIRILEDADADAIVRQALAVFAPEHDPVKFVGPEAAAARTDELLQKTAGEPEPEREKAMQELAELTQDLGLYDTPAPEPKPEMKRPWGTASKADWIDWAVHCGAKQEEAAGLTKQQLMSRYGASL